MSGVDILVNSLFYGTVFHEAMSKAKLYMSLMCQKDVCIISLNHTLNGSKAPILFVWLHFLIETVFLSFCTLWYEII